MNAENDDYNHFHFMETACSDDTPLTTCNEGDDVCLMYDITYDTTRRYNYLDDDDLYDSEYSYEVSVQMYRCGKDGDDPEDFCEEYKKWHDEQYEMNKGEGATYYAGARIAKCTSETIKKGRKYINILLRLFTSMNFTTHAALHH